MLPMGISRCLRKLALIQRKSKKVSATNFYLYSKYLSNVSCVTCHLLPVLPYILSKLY